ncbi:hypothetical protein [Mycobacterium sp. OAE908]|uniref:hypothetical protein n=1 Tax=Mycobacterium sp. OAE908 TaxID=2817899 RepID=UPI001AE692E1
MNLRTTVARTLLSTGVAITGIGLASGTAQADPHWFHWCPGQSRPVSDDRPIDWDWSVCHAFYLQSSGNGYQPADLIDESGRVYPAAPAVPPATPCMPFIGPLPCGL